VDFSDTFAFNQNDVIEVYSWYEWTTGPDPPLDPATFHFTIKLANLSIAACSARDNGESDAKQTSPGLFTLNEQINVQIPFGTYINYKIWRFTPGLTGRYLIDVRMNILTEQVKLPSGALVPMFASNWFTYLSINGVLQPAFLNYATIANSPVLYNGSVFPSSQVFYLLADLNAGDEVSVMAMHQTDALILIDSPPGFAPVNSQGVVCDLQMSAVVSAPLVTNGRLRGVSDQKVTVPLDGSSLDNAIVLPFGTDAQFAFGDGFQWRNGQLTYVASKPKSFKVNAMVNIDGLELKTADGDTVVVDIQTMGFAVGVNGQKYNLVRTESNVYHDTRYILNIRAAQTTTNVIQLQRNQALCLLVYFKNAKYLNQVPVRGLPSLTPAPGSSINFTGRVALSVESVPDDLAGSKQVATLAKRK
jgi:hypothetical protein